MRANDYVWRGRLPHQVADGSGATGGDASISTCSGGTGESCSCRSSGRIGEACVGTKCHDPRPSNRNLSSDRTVHLLKVIEGIGRVRSRRIHPPVADRGVRRIVVKEFEIEASLWHRYDAQERPLAHFTQTVHEAKISRSKRTRAAAVRPRKCVYLHARAAALKGEAIYLHIEADAGQLWRPSINGDGAGCESHARRAGSDLSRVAGVSIPRLANGRFLEADKDRRWDVHVGCAGVVAEPDVIESDRGGGSRAGRHKHDWISGAATREVNYIFKLKGTGTIHLAAPE